MRIGHLILSTLLFLLPGCFGWRLSAQGYVIERVKENIVLDAVRDYDAGQFEEAAKKLENLLKNDPDNDAAYYYLGLARYMMKDMDAAEAALSAAVEKDSSNFWYRYRLAAIYAVTDRKEEAAQIYNGLLEDFPKKSDLYYGLIELYMSMGKMEEALETLDQIDTVFGKSDISAMTRFDILRSLNRLEQAYETLEEYNKEYSSPQVLSLLGDYQMSMYNDSTALSCYEEALDIAPGYAPALLGKAEVFRMTRRYEDYFSTLNTFVSEKEIPSEGKCDYLKAIIQHADPNFLRTFQPQMDSVVTNLMASSPKDSSVTAIAGIYYYGTGRQDKAREHFRANLENWPESVSASANYAEALMYMGEWEELSSFSKSAFGKFPTETGFLEMATLADYQLDAYGDVISTCSTIIERFPQDSAMVLTACTTMGDMYYKLGEKKHAYKSYEQALKINPNHLPVLNNYAYFLSLEGKKLKKARTMSKITVDKEPDNATYLDTYGWILYLQGKSAEAKPYFKHAMLYGGKDSAVSMDHYAEVLFDLGEYAQAFLYWNRALNKDTEGEIDGLEEKIKLRKAQMQKAQEKKKGK